MIIRHSSVNMDASAHHPNSPLYRTWTFKTPQHSKPNQFVCRLNYINKQSLVKFPPLRSKILRQQDACKDALTSKQPENIYHELTGQSRLWVWTQPEPSLRTQHPVLFSFCRSCIIAFITFSSRRIHGEYFAPRWIRSACMHSNTRTLPQTQTRLHSKCGNHRDNQSP